MATTSVETPHLGLPRWLWFGPSTHQSTDQLFSHPTHQLTPRTPTAARGITPALVASGPPGPTLSRPRVQVGVTARRATSGRFHTLWRTPNASLQSPCRRHRHGRAGSAAFHGAGPDGSTS